MSDRDIGKASRVNTSHARTKNTMTSGIPISIQFPKLIGKTTVEQIVKYFNGEKVEKEILIPTSLYYKADAEADPDLKKK